MQREPKGFQNHLAREYKSYVLAFVFLILVCIFFYHPKLYALLTVEDGPFETATAVGFFGASCLFLFSVRATNGTVINSVLAAMGIMAFVVAGEEISWGQRMFGVSTPEYLKEINFQDEINIHNIGIVNHVFNWISIFAALFVISLYWFCTSYRFGKIDIEIFRPNKLTFSMFVLYIVSMIFGGLVSNYWDEVSELILSISILLYAVTIASAGRGK